jgi:hypothetical protein
VLRAPPQVCACSLSCVALHTHAHSHATAHSQQLTQQCDTPAGPNSEGKRQASPTARACSPWPALLAAPRAPREARLAVVRRGRPSRSSLLTSTRTPSRLALVSRMVRQILMARLILASSPSAPSALRLLCRTRRSARAPPRPFSLRLLRPRRQPTSPPRCPRCAPMPLLSSRSTRECWRK